MITQFQSTTSSEGVDLIVILEGVQNFENLIGNTIKKITEAHPGIASVVEGVESFSTGVMETVVPAGLR
jgi:hypothetical protein